MLLLKWEELKITDIPKTRRWRLPEMRKTSLVNPIETWRVGFNGMSLIFWIGQEDQKPISTKEKMELNSDINIKAWLYAKKLYLDKRKDGYSPPCLEETPLISIMRGEHYSSSMKLNFPVDVDDKLDGQRMYCRTRFPYEAEGLSRGNCNLPNISSILKEVTAFSMYLPSNCIVDGELWHPDYQLSEIISIIKSKSDPRIKYLEYHIFDLWWDEDLSQEQRRRLLERSISMYREDIINYKSVNEYGNGGRIKELIGKTKLFTTTIQIAYSHDDIERIHRYNVDERGLEGSIVRKRANESPEDSSKYNMSRYLFGKGSRILKVLDFIYEEGLCVKMLNTKGGIKMAVKDIRGNITVMKVEGEQSLRRKWLQNQSLVIGKYVTFKYKHLTGNNILVSAVVKNIREEIGWSPEILISFDSQDNFHEDE